MDFSQIPVNVPYVGPDMTGEGQTGGMMDHGMLEDPYGQVQFIADLHNYIIKVFVFILGFPWVHKV